MLKKALEKAKRVVRVLCAYGNNGRHTIDCATLYMVARKLPTVFFMSVPTSCPHVGNTKNKVNFWKT